MVPQRRYKTAAVVVGNTATANVPEVHGGNRAFQGERRIPGVQRPPADAPRLPHGRRGGIGTAPGRLAGWPRVIAVQAQQFLAEDHGGQKAGIVFLLDQFNGVTAGAGLMVVIDAPVRINT